MNGNTRGAMLVALIEVRKVKRFFLFVLMSVFSPYTYSGFFDRDAKWKEYRTDEGCIINISYKNYFDVSYSWGDECEEGRGITGKGELKQLSSGGDCAVFSGEMINGYWIGTVHRNLYKSSCDGNIYDSRNFSFPKPEATKLLANYPVANNSLHPTGQVVEKSKLGECVSLVNPKRITKITKFDTDKGHSETRSDALNLTLKNSCNSDQIVGLIIKYEAMHLHTGGFAHLQLPESPYFDINSERQTLTSVGGYAQLPFAGTLTEPYAFRFVPEQPISQYLFGQLLPAGAESKGMFVVPHGEVLDFSDPRTQVLEYYVASCAARKGDVQQGMFWDPARRYLACPGWVPVKVVK